MNIDITKPIVNRDGRPAKIIASGLTGPIPGLKNVAYFGGETLLIEAESGELFYIYEDGRTFRDSPHPRYVNAPERTSVFRQFAPKGNGGARGNMTFGGMEHATLAEARNGATFIGNEGILELVREGGKLVDVKFHTR